MAILWGWWVENVQYGVLKTKWPSSCDETQDLVHQLLLRPMNAGFGAFVIDVSGDASCAMTTSPPSSGFA